MSREKSKIEGGTITVTLGVGDEIKDIEYVGPKRWPHGEVRRMIALLSFAIGTLEREETNEPVAAA